MMTIRTRLGIAPAVSFGSWATGWAEPPTDGGRLGVSVNRSVAGMMTPGAVGSDRVDRQAQDRGAILAMAGEYRGAFRFEQSMPINRDDRVGDVDFTAGQAYWAETSAYWHDVRRRWKVVLRDEGRHRVAAYVEDKPIDAHLFGVAKDVREAGRYLPEHNIKMHAVTADSMEPTSDILAGIELNFTPTARS